MTQGTDTAGTVRLEVEGHIATVTIARPEKRNAIDVATAMGIAHAVDRIETDDQIWIGILAADGEVFSSGADLAVLAAEGPARLLTREGGFAGLTQRKRAKVLIAAVDGPALAGGCELALACDLIVASSAASFGLPEVRRGLLAGAGGVVMLPRLLPRNVAMHMLTTGLPLAAADAHRYGLLAALVEPGGALAAALDLAGVIAANAPVPVRASRQCVAAADELPGREVWQVMNDVIEVIGRTDDRLEGMRAFVEKRPPNWTGR